VSPLAPGERVGFIGLGTMGEPMARHLLRAGFALALHARRPEAAAALLAEGASWADSPAALAAGTRAVCLCLPDAPDIAGVLPGLLAAAPRGMLLLDFSTIAPAAARAHHALCAAHGVAALDVPVSGGRAGAEAARLTVFAGGDAGALEAARPLLAALARQVTHLGPPGAGQVGKAANQMVTSATMHAVSEALLMAEAQGIDPAALREAMLGGSARSAVLEGHAARMIAGAFEPPGFRAELMHKDLGIALAAARETGTPAPSAERVATTLAEMIKAGEGPRDTLALHDWLRRARR
jgi:2-hydroxy-3-oxopropionate reductase